jgi:3-oxoacyl-(acyl-carrier-protein) synthase
MKTIINNVELIDANGTSYSNCIENYLKGNSANFTRHNYAPLNGLPKFDIPLTDDELDSELEKIDYLESNMTRAIKLAVLAAGRCAVGMNLPKNTPVIGVTLQGSQETGGMVWKALFAEKRMISPRWGATVTQSSICTTVSRHLGLTGPSFMINQACSAFITAFDIAEKFLNSNQCEAVLVFGVDCATHPYTTYIFNSMGVCTKDLVKPFDVNRSGMALGEGVACYIVTKENNARKNLGAIGKISLYNDYYNLTAPSPDGSAGKFLLNEITDNNNIKLDSINCHVTATKVGDEAEILALDSIPYKTHIYGLKGSVGHTMSSSAGIELAYSLAGLNQGWIPYTSTTDETVECKHDIVLKNPIYKETSNFAKLSFGFGGVSGGIRIDKT